MGGIPSPAPDPAASMNQPGAGEEAVPVVTRTGNAPLPGQTGPHTTVAPKGTGASPPPPRAVIADQPAVRRLPDPSKVNASWWIFAALLLALGIVWSIVVAWGTGFSHAHRLSVAGTALLDVVALAALAHVVLLWYQSGVGSGPATDPVQETVDYRRRGLKAAVMGQDGRASTSKAQVVLWTGAVVWALIDLLLLARAYPGGNLFTRAVSTNWRPEYLVLLGLTVASAATAKAVVSGSNAGQGPLTKDQAKALLGKATHVYQRDPVPAGVKGFITGVAELITADDRTVAWQDLQYVIFTLITLVFFVVQVLAQPQQGLPPVPAALLTLMGVSAAGDTALKIVQAKGTAPPQD